MKKVLILENGEQFPIIKGEGKFWICENTKFRKSNPQIREIKNIAPKKEQKKEE